MVQIGGYVQLNIKRMAEWSEMRIGNSAIRVRSHRQSQYHLEELLVSNITLFVLLN